MRIKVVRNIPGLVAFRVLATGREYEIDNPTAISLIRDGYAAPVAECPAEKRETRGPGRPRKES